MENYVPQSTASATNNQPHVFTDSFSMPTFSHQYATPVFLSFPPPCTFGPADYSQQLSNNNQDAASNAVAAGGSQIFVHRISEINSACNQQSCASQSNDRVIQMADSFASLNMDDSHGSVPRPDSTSSTGTSILDYHIPPSYSVVLPSATILHHLGANIPSHVYQQFSPVITQNVPQFHSVYPLNTVDPGSHPAVTTNILATQPLSAVSSVNDSQTKNLPNSAVFSSHLMVCVQNNFLVSHHSSFCIPFCFRSSGSYMASSSTPNVWQPISLILEPVCPQSRQKSQYTTFLSAVFASSFSL